MSEALDVEVKALLERRRGEWAEVAKTSGISYSWISKFVNDRIPNPGYVTLRDLRRHLTCDVNGTEQAR